MSKTKKLVVIDGKSVFYRGYYAMPNLSLPDGTPMGGVYGFAMMALEVIKRFEPDYVCIAWDKSKTNIRARRKIYPEYKANRKPMPDDMREQIPYLRELLNAFNWPLYEVDDYEADDIMGAFALQAKEMKDVDTILITGDLDVLQLVNHHTHVYAQKRGLTNIEKFDVEHFQEKYDMTPEQFIDYKALRGDPSDNIPGVKGVGEKTATKLIKEHGSLDGIYKNLDSIKGSVRKKLERDKEMAYKSKELVTIMTDVPLDIDLEESTTSNLDPQAVLNKLEEYRFRSLIKQLPEVMKVDPSKLESELDSININVEQINDSWPKELDDCEQLMLYELPANNLFDQGTLLLSPHKSIGYSLSMDKLSSQKELYNKLKSILEDKACSKVGFDIKTVIKNFKNLNIDLVGIGHDLRIAAFLINPLKREQELQNLIGGKLDMDDQESILGAMWSVYPRQLKDLKDLPKLNKLANEVEWPTIKVLADMEYKGIGFDKDKMSELSKKFQKEISQLEKKIHSFSEDKFNISSPQQLSKVLFEELDLPTEGIKKGKTGYSTAAKTLDKLSGEHEIIDLIKKYREYTKIKSTYIDTLPKMIGKDGRLHTTYDLDVAATGRLSSHDPNLQNIPASDGLGKQIRNAFVADKGMVFIAADYSQFELRLAAILSGDEKMIKSFKEGADIHTQTIVDVYGKDPDEVTANERRNSKAINFGVMYGLGPHGLAQQTGMEFKEAKEFITKFFEARSGLRKYLDELEEQVKKDGYVETMFGRRRPTPDIHSSNFMVRESAKRAAMNMPFQGTAADIMKMAMIRLHDELPEDVDMLLQIHDSVIVECPESKKDEVAKQIKEIMESTVDLKISLPVDVKMGKNWGEL